MYFETNRANHFAIALLLLHLGLGVRFTNCTNHLNQCLPELIVLSPLFFSPNIFPISVHATVFCSQLRKWRFFLIYFHRRCRFLVHFSSLSMAYLRWQTVPFIYRFTALLFFFLLATWNSFIRFMSVRFTNGFDHFSFVSLQLM